MADEEEGGGPLRRAPGGGALLLDPDALARDPGTGLAELRGALGALLAPGLDARADALAGALGIPLGAHCVGIGGALLADAGATWTASGEVKARVLVAIAILLRAWVALGREYISARRCRR
jgi:hypothetical protein